MTLVSKTLAPNAPFVDLSNSGRLTREANNYLNSLSILANSAAGGTIATAPGSGLQGGGDLASNLSLSIAPHGVTDAMIRQSAGYSVIGRFAGTTGDVADITATANNRVLARIGNVLAFYDTTLIPATVADGNYGDITVSGTGSVWTINNNVVSNAKLAQVPTSTFKGRTTAGTGNAEDLTATQATALLNAFSSTLKGLAPASGGGTVNYLRADGIWASPPGLGTVTSVSVVTANGVSGSVANPTTTPAITLTLGAITPSSVNASGTVTGSNLSGTNTGDQTITLTGDVTGSGTGSFAATIGANKVTFAKFVAATQKSLVGATAAGNFGEITLGSGVAITAGVLSATGTGGTVTSVSVVTANGFSGTVATATTTPAITLSYAGAALTKTDDTNVTLTLGGTPATALLQAASLTLGWTGTLGVARGGTNIASYAVGDILYASASTTLSKLPDVATGNALISGGVTTAPSWGKIGLTTHVSGTLPIANGGTNQTSLGDITRTSDTNVTLTLGGTPTGAVITSTSFTLGWTGTLAVSRGGLGVGTITGLMQGNGTSAVTGITDSSTTGQTLRVTGASTYAWGALSLSTAAAITGTLPVGNGGTGITSLGTGIATWLGTPSSANLAAAVTDETGSGALVFANTPTLVTPVIGAATGTSLAVTGNITTSAGSIGASTASPATKLDMGAHVTDDNAYTYEAYSGLFVNQTPTSATAINDPTDILHLARQGTGGVCYGVAAVFRLSRYVNSGTNSRTRLDLVLANANYLTSPTTVMTAQSDGSVGFGVTAPTCPVHSSGAIKTASTTVASLPSASAVGAGGRHFVTDALAPTFLTAVVGGGAIATPVFSDGTSWKAG